MIPTFNLQKTKIGNLRSETTRMNTDADDEMALSEHIEEFSQRTVFCILLIIISTFACFADVREIVKVFQAPAIGVKFLQFAPGEYFFASFKIAAFSGLLISSPIVFYQILLYLIPGLTKSERNIILPVSFGSGVLFFCRISFFLFFTCPGSFKILYFLWFGSSGAFLVLRSVFRFYCCVVICNRSCFPSSSSTSCIRSTRNCFRTTNALLLEICCCYLYSFSGHYYPINGSSNTNINVICTFNSLSWWVRFCNFYLTK